MASLASQVGTVSLNKMYRIDTENGYYQGTSPDEKAITGWGTRFYISGLGPKGDLSGRSEGEFKNGKQDGKGVRFTNLSQADGGGTNRYEGDFKEDKYSGTGNKSPSTPYHPTPPPPNPIKCLLLLLLLCVGVSFRCFVFVKITFIRV